MTVNVRERVFRKLWVGPNASIFNKKVEEDLQGY